MICTITYASGVATIVSSSVSRFRKANPRLITRATPPFARETTAPIGSPTSIVRLVYFTSAEPTELKPNVKYVIIRIEDMELLP